MLNIFLLVLGMVMDGFSAILVAVPLILPFAARFDLHPFHLAMMFLLNLELAFCAPPLGLNLFIASFRFEKPLASLYRVVLPFTAILGFGLLLVMYVPVDLDGARRRGHPGGATPRPSRSKEAPREAWLLQCVQEDRSNPRPVHGGGQGALRRGWDEEPLRDSRRRCVPVPDERRRAAPADDADDLMKQMMGDTPKGAADKAKDDHDDLLREMMGDTPKGAASAAPSAKPSDANDDLMKEMMGEKK